MKATLSCTCNDCVIDLQNYRLMQYGARAALWSKLETHKFFAQMRGKSEFSRIWLEPLMDSLKEFDKQLFER